MDIDDYLGELEHIVETIEVQRDLYHLTDQDEWIREDRKEPDELKGPVNEEIARYNIGSLDYFIELWSKAEDASADIKNDLRQESTNKKLRKYAKIERKIFENSDFLEDIYDLEKPLEKTKVEAGRS